MRCVRIELWESDQGQTTPDEKLADGVTDANGYFVFPQMANRDIDEDQGRLDLYLKVFLSSQSPCVGAAVIVTDAAFPVGQTWSYVSPPQQDATGDLGTIKPSDYSRRSAFHIYDVILKGHDWAAARGIQPPGAWTLQVRWQQGLAEVSGYNAPIIDISGVPDGDTHPDEWDDATILHEYGHHLQYLFGFGNLDASCEHSVDAEPECPPGLRSPEVAFNEGFADFFAAAAQTPPSPTIRDVGVNTNYQNPFLSTINIETGDYSINTNLIGNFAGLGWTWQLPMSATLWDLYDTGTEGQFCPDCCYDQVPNTISYVWDVLANRGGASMKSVYDFYSLYCQRYLEADTTLKKLVNRVFCRHGMLIVSCGGMVSVEDGGSFDRLGVRVWPNPARKSVTLAVDVPTLSRVDLQLFDIAGRKIRTLLQGPIKPGRRVVKWDGTDEVGKPVRGGMYVCRLVAGSTRLSTSLMFIR
jgi:hypothetical protein